MDNSNIFITTSFRQTQKLGEILAEELKGGEFLCLSGELGSGKTTFAQGLLKGLGAKGPYTSPTFVVMKQYKVLNKVRPFPSKSGALEIPQGQTLNIYHIDAYRVGPKDIMDLGWEEIVASAKNIVIVEWAERIRKIIPKDAVWLEFRHLKDDEREIILKSQCQNPNDKQNPKSQI